MDPDLWGMFVSDERTLPDGVARTEEGVRHMFQLAVQQRAVHPDCVPWFVRYVSESRLRQAAEEWSNGNEVSGLVVKAFLKDVLG
jgi:hypothetical protein